MSSPLTRWWRRVRFGEPIYVVSGLPRSGTSMASRMLEGGGLAIVQDGIRTADEDNPRGYFEDERVKNLAQSEDRSWVRAARGRVVKVISYLLRTLPADSNYKVVFMDRNLLEVVASQNKMLERRGEKNESTDQRMAELLEDDLWKARYLLKHGAHFEWLELNYKAVVDDPRRAAAQMRDFIGKPAMDVDRMAAAVEKELYRNRR